MTEISIETTIVMRTKNNEDIVGQTLDALFSQRNASFELLIVDSGSTDDTLNIAASFPHRRIDIKPEEYQPGPVLNRAVQHVKTSITTFLNSDTVLLSPYSLESLLEPIQNKRAEVTFARQIARPDAEGWAERDYEYAFPKSSTAGKGILLSLPFASFLTTRLTERPFYSDAWASEDSEWGKWAIDNAVSIEYVERAIAMHSHNYTQRQMYGRQMVEAEADVFIFDGKAPSTSTIIANSLKRMASDLLWHQRNGRAYEFPLAVAKRMSATVGRIRGNALGKRRFGSRNAHSDASEGMKVALDTHPSSDKGS